MKSSNTPEKNKFEETERASLMQFSWESDAEMNQIASDLDEIQSYINQISGPATEETLMDQKKKNHTPANYEDSQSIIRSRSKFLPDINTGRETMDI